MARLFIGPREMNFISDLTKEIVKDINGQRIYLFPISEKKTKVDDVYNEAIDKVYDNPIMLDALVDSQYQEQTRINQFGVDSVYNIEAFVQYRDLIDKGVQPAVGDFFSFGEVFYEITSTRVLKNIFGQAEHKNGVILIGTKARKGQFEAKLYGPTDIKYTDEDAVQKTFVQQRGYESNDEGATGDTRELYEQDVIERPLEGAREVSPKGANFDNSNYESSFYSGEED